MCSWSVHVKYIWTRIICSNVHIILYACAALPLPLKRSYSIIQKQWKVSRAIKYTHTHAVYIYNTVKWVRSWRIFRFIYRSILRSIILYTFIPLHFLVNQHTHMRSHTGELISDRVTEAFVRVTWPFSRKPQWIPPTTLTRRKRYRAVNGAHSCGYIILCSYVMYMCLI